MDRGKSEIPQDLNLHVLQEIVESSHESDEGKKHE